MSEFIEELEGIKREADNLISRLEELKRKIDDKISETRASLISQILNLGGVDQEALKAFLEEPYVIIPNPKKREEWWVIAPKFIPFSLGWLERSTKSYNIFVVNRYMKWIAQIPRELEERLFGGRVPPPYKIADGWLITGAERLQKAWKRYRRYLSFRKGDKIRIRKGYEFQLISELIRSGCLPFIPQPVDENDLRDVPLSFKLRDYQEKAWKTFLQYGAMGVYYPFGSGKTMIGLWAIAHLKGDKLVVVPTLTLKEQWIERIEKYLPHTCKYEVEVVTYHAFDKVKGKKYSLVIYDECHRLPAETFIRLATLKTKYRIGLSGSPYREDGRTDLIIALTGYPVGLEWSKFFKLGIVKKPTVTLYLVSDLRGKLRKLDELLKERKKTLVFCDSIELGKRVASRYGVNFIYGATRKRLKKLREGELCVVSRVGDEGVSLPSVERVIEVEFLFGSRRQEIQRLGRLFHSISRVPEHYILMTEAELEAYEKRLYAIYEKGFRVNIVR